MLLCQAKHSANGATLHQLSFIRVGASLPIDRFLIHPDCGNGANPTEN